jgi:hypothetical protein
MTSDTMVASALLDLSRAAPRAGAAWALIGGQALIAYGVPRETLDADALVPLDGLERVAAELVETFGWTPLTYDKRSDDYVVADEVRVHFMDDPVLFDVGQERQMIPLRSPLGLPVELLAAQHPVEEEMVDAAVVRSHQGVSVPIAPLGGILLVKAKADRQKDVAAIEQAAEHLSASQVRGAVAWAAKRDAATAQDLRSMLTAARVRRAPNRTEPSKRKR